MLVSLLHPDHYLLSSPTFALIHNLLHKQLPAPAADWLNQSLTQVASAQKGQSFMLLGAFSMAARRVGKASLQLTPTDTQRAHRLCPGWQLATWSCDQAARSLLLLASVPPKGANIDANHNPSAIQQDYRQLVQQLFDNADVGELIALYQSLPLLPQPESYLTQAIEGARSSMTAVFQAIALRNPYPARYFDQPTWNQMVLKALFEGSQLSLIEGLDQRANPQLARMLSAYAHERWAAHRTVDPELWRLVGPFAEADLVADLARVLTQEDPNQQAAAALACAQSSAAQDLLKQRPDLQALVQSKTLTWQNFAQKR
jgi:hypothetical protein